jgi:hypothetical protein
MKIFSTFLLLLVATVPSVVQAEVGAAAAAAKALKNMDYRFFVAG